MENVIIATVLSFVITYFAIPVLIQVAELKHLYDEPDERKSHKSRIPTLGGLGFFAGFMLASAVCVPSQQTFPLQYLLAAFFVIFIVGMKDDIVGLSPMKKLIGQLVAAFAVIYLGNLQIRNMYGFFGIGELPYHFSLLLTYFTFIVVINAFNLIDGIDGLAGSVGLLVSAVLGAYFLYTNELLYAVMGFSLAAGLAAFLIYNITPARIFMGDTGSLLVGLVNAALIVKFIEVAGNPAGKNADSFRTGNCLCDTDHSPVRYPARICHPHVARALSFYGRQASYPPLHARVGAYAQPGHPGSRFVQYRVYRAGVRPAGSGNHCLALPHGRPRPGCHHGAVFTEKEKRKRSRPCGGAGAGARGNCQRKHYQAQNSPRKYRKHSAG